MVANDSAKNAKTPAKRAHKPVRLTKTQARELFDRIKAHAVTLWQELGEAYLGRGWEALGYESWDACCEVEFRDLRLRMPREERTEIVCSLRQAGLSIRAISAATGASKTTVEKDIDQLSKTGTVELPDTVVSLDGRERPARRDDSGGTVISLPVEFVEKSAPIVPWRQLADLTVRDLRRSADARGPGARPRA